MSILVIYELWDVVLGYACLYIPTIYQYNFKKLLWAGPSVLFPADSEYKGELYGNSYSGICIAQALRYFYLACR
jgi:hypothetical protein